MQTLIMFVCHIYIYCLDRRCRSITFQLDSTIPTLSSTLTLDLHCGGEYTSTNIIRSLCTFYYLVDEYIGKVSIIKSKDMMQSLKVISNNLDRTFDRESSKRRLLLPFESVVFFSSLIRPSSITNYAQFIRHRNIVKLFVCLHMYVHKRVLCEPTAVAATFFLFLLFFSNETCRRVVYTCLVEIHFSFCLFKNLSLSFQAAGRSIERMKIKHIVFFHDHNIERVEAKNFLKYTETIDSSINKTTEVNLIRESNADHFYS